MNPTDVVWSKRKRTQNKLLHFIYMCDFIYMELQNKTNVIIEIEIAVMLREPFGRLTMIYVFKW